MLLFKVALGQSCGWQLFECHGVRGAGSRLSDKRLCPRRCLTRPLGAHHPAPWWPPPAYLGRALLLNELWHRLEEMSFSSTKKCRGWLFKAEDAQIYQLPPRRCGYSRPISHVRPTGGCWRCRPSLGDTIWAVLPRGQGNRGGKNERPDLGWVTVRCILFFQKKQQLGCCTARTFRRGHGGSGSGWRSSSSCLGKRRHTAEQTLGKLVDTHWI